MLSASLNKTFPSFLILSPDTNLTVSNLQYHLKLTGPMDPSPRSQVPAYSIPEPHQTLRICLSVNWGCLRGLLAQYFAALRQFLAIWMESHLFLFQWFLNARGHILQVLANFNFHGQMLFLGLTDLGWSLTSLVWALQFKMYTNVSLLATQVKIILKFSFKPKHSRMI